MFCPSFQELFVFEPGLGSKPKSVVRFFLCDNFSFCRFKKNVSWFLVCENTRELSEFSVLSAEKKDELLFLLVIHL